MKKNILVGVAVLGWITSISCSSESRETDRLRFVQQMVAVAGEALILQRGFFVLKNTDGKECNQLFLRSKQLGSKTPAVILKEGAFTRIGSSCRDIPVYLTLCEFRGALADQTLVLPKVFLEAHAINNGKELMFLVEASNFSDLDEWQVLERRIQDSGEYVLVEDGGVKYLYFSEA